MACSVGLPDMLKGICRGISRAIAAVKGFATRVVRRGGRQQ